MPGRVLVKFKAGVPSDRAVAALARWGLRVVGQIPRLGVLAVAVPRGRERAALESLRRDPLVAYAELDHAARALEVPNDPRWPEQWNMAIIRADLAWEVVTDTHGIVIATLDSGVDLDHPDLEARIWTHPGEVPGNGLDDDGNGKVDDVHGWHFYHVCSYSDCWPGENNDVQDRDGHGTHVAGIAAAEANNGIGVAGLAWGALLMPVKVLEDRYSEAWYSDIAAGMVYATDNGAAIINLSLGGEEPGQTLEEAVAYAHQRGVLLVAAAGNDDGPILYPAALNSQQKNTGCRTFPQLTKKQFLGGRYCIRQKKGDIRANRCFEYYPKQGKKDKCGPKEKRNAAAVSCHRIPAALDCNLRRFLGSRYFEADPPGPEEESLSPAWTWPRHVVEATSSTVAHPLQV